MAKTQRIRDPVHGLIAFRESDPLDQLAWALLNTPEFQRLRRIKQLGFCEFVFPGATHTRLAHCIGVFEMARKLVGIIGRELRETNNERAEIAAIAALLHDVGHGPFSHAFEQAQRTRGRRKRHEEWTAQIIRDPNGQIHPLLEQYRPGFSDAIADLLIAETPADIYDAVVSSSFDADRLDYLRRDRMMTGSGAGAIDFDWLMENLRIRAIDFDPGGDESGPLQRVSFCLHEKAREAAETFLLARFHLYSQVYLHKATRGIEQMLSALLRGVATAVDAGRFADIGIEEAHPLARFYQSGGEDAEAYLALDDMVIWGALERISSGSDVAVRTLAKRLRNRELFKCLDIETEFPESAERQRRESRRIEREFAAEMESTVFKDTASVSIYGVVGADDAEAQKRLMILTRNGLREITELSPVVEPLSRGKGRTFTRFFFADPTARDRARDGK
jgi:uncharacterized protein